MNYYIQDGKKSSEIWKISKLSETSDIWNNINSKIGHRKDRNIIKQVIFKAGK